MPVPTIANRRVVTEKALGKPYAHVRDSYRDGDDATGTRVLLVRTNLGNVLHDPGFSLLHFGSTTARRSREIERFGFVTLSAIASPH